MRCFLVIHISYSLLYLNWLSYFSSYLPCFQTFLNLPDIGGLNGLKCSTTRMFSEAHLCARFESFFVDEVIFKTNKHRGKTENLILRVWVFTCLYVCAPCACLVATEARRGCWIWNHRYMQLWVALWRWELTGPLQQQLLSHFFSPQTEDFYNKSFVLINQLT